MTIVDQQQLLGDILPNVYISKIVLKTSGDTLIVDNPHIDSSKENYSLVELKNQSDKSLKITVNVCVKEKISDDNILSWFENQDLTKYINIKIYQITDTRLSQIVSSGTDMLDLLDTSKNVSYDDIRYIYASYIYGIDDIETLNDTIRRHSSFKIINLNKNKNFNNASDQFKSYVDQAGNQFYDITYVVDFIHPNSEPEHLSYFAISSFDIQEFSKDFKIKLNSSNLENIITKISSDIVIESGQTVSRSFIFYDRDGRIWTGPVVQSGNDSWFTGVQIDENSKPLVRSVVNNYKIQDNRNFKKLSIDTRTLYNKYAINNTTKLLTNDNTIPSKKENYFSELFLTRGAAGDSKFFFAVNIEKIIKEKSIYGNLLNGSEKIKQEILKNCTIKSLNIYRKRVKAIENTYSTFDSNEPIEYIVASRDSEKNSFITSNNNRGSLRESFIVSNNKQNFLRYFTGIDKLMSFVNTGLYQYVVSIEIEDGIIDFVQAQIELLLLAKTELQQYYEISVIPSVSQTKLEIQDPHIQHPSETLSSKQYRTSYYDPVSDQFTQEFENFMKQKYPTDSLMLAPWISPISVYLSVLDIFTDIVDSPVQRQKYIRDLYNSISPMTGNPQGILTVINLLDSLINNLSKSIGVTTTISPRKFGNFAQKNSSFSRSPRETIKIEKTFEQVFDSDTIKDFIYDYLSDGEDDTENNDGLRTIAGQKFNERVQSEILKHFGSAADSIKINSAENNILIDDSLENTSFTYLSPVRIDTPQKSYVITKKRKKKKTTQSQEQILGIDREGGYGVIYGESANAAASNIGQTTEVAYTAKPISTLTSRTVENITESPAGKESELSKIVSAIIKNTTTTSVSNYPTNQTVSNTAIGATVKNPVQTNSQESSNNYANILSSREGLTIETNFLRRSSPLRVLKEQPPTIDLKTTNFNDKFELTKEFYNNVQDKKDYGFGGLNALSSLVLSYLNFEKQKNKNPKSKDIFIHNNSLLKILNVKSTELKIYKDQDGDIIIEGFPKTLTEEQFKKLPNVTKNLFLRNRVSQKQAELVPTPQTQMNNVQIFDYSLLNKLEYFEGFEVNQYGEILLTSPIWKDLTKSVFESKVGKELLCRMKKYINPAIGLTQLKALNKPFYDEVFILIPETSEEEDLDTKPIKVTNKEVADQIVNSVQNAIPGVSFVQVAVKRTKERNKKKIRRRLQSEQQIIRSLSQNINSTRPLSAAILEENITNLSTSESTTYLQEEPQKINIPGKKLSRREILLQQKRDSQLNLSGISESNTPTIDKILNPTMITIVQENDVGEQLIKKFQIKNKSSIVRAIKYFEERAGVQLRGVEVQVPVKIASELIAMHAQTAVVKQEFMNSNIVASNKLLDQVNQNIEQISSEEQK